MFVQKRQPDAPDFWGQFLTNTGNEIGNRYLSNLDQERDNKNILSAFSKIDENSSPLDIIQAISTSNISHEKQKLLLDGIKGTNGFNKSITPYQNEIVKQRQVQLDLQRKRIDAASQKNKQDLPKMISAYTKSYSKDADLDPDDKLELDRYVRESYNDGQTDLDQSLQEGIEYIAQKRDIIENTPVVDKPFFAGMRKEARENSMQEMTNVLREAYDSGVRSNRDLKKIALRGGWEPQEINQMISRVRGKPSKKPKQESKKIGAAKGKKIKLNSQKEKESAAREILRETKGNKESAMKLFEERYE